MPKDKEISPKWKPCFLKNHEFMKFIFEFQNAFCIVFDLNCEIKYVSDEIKHLLGYDPKTLKDKSVFDIIDEKSAKQIKNMLKSNNFMKENIKFLCKFKKGSHNCDTSNELFRITGVFKRTPNSVIESIGHFNTIARLEPSNRITENKNNINIQAEFHVEFSLGLKFTKSDLKTAKLIGYSPLEILGTSAYDYCLLSDLEKLVDCHKQLIETRNPSSISYRFLTKGEEALLVTANFSLLYKSSVINCKYSLGSSGPSLMETKTSNIIIPKIPSNNNEIANLSQEMDKRKRESPAVNENNRKRLNSNNDAESFSPYPINIKDNEDQNKMANSYSTNELSQENVPKSYVEQNSESRLDESLAAIFLQSYKNPEYRIYVLNQLNIKKMAAEKKIKKQQDDLLTLTNIIENIKDVKKLGTWLQEFQGLRKAKVAKPSDYQQITPVPMNQNNFTQNQINNLYTSDIIITNDRSNSNQTINYATMNSSQPMNNASVQSNSNLANNSSMTQMSQKFDYMGNNQPQQIPNINTENLSTSKEDNASIEIFEKIFNNYSMETL